MTEYKHMFVTIEERDHMTFAKKVEKWLGRGYYIIGANVGITHEVVKWFPPKIERVYYAFLQKTIKIEDEPDDDTENPPNAQQSVIWDATEDAIKKENE